MLTAVKHGIDRFGCLFDARGSREDDVYARNLVRSSMQVLLFFLGLVWPTATA